MDWAWLKSHCVNIIIHKTRDINLMQWEDCSGLCFFYIRIFAFVMLCNLTLLAVKHFILLISLLSADYIKSN